MVTSSNILARGYTVQKLKRIGRSPTAKTRPSARLVLIAWGFEYIERLMNYTMPAILAPGNLPYLAKYLDCDITIVTERKYFDYLERHPTTTALREHCGIRLVSMDDMLYEGMYGLTITLANFRGFEDLGEAMVDTYLVFIFTDFILGDGSFRTLVEKIQQGERLIMAPSYRVLRKNVEPIFATRIDFETRQLSIPCREMAKLILDNRHYTIRAKTINQRLYHIGLFEQFYMQVDENTLICRQNPFALVCMRPERPLFGIETFWDYGILEEACPNTRICALGDSDEFVMAELQDAEPIHDHDTITPGWESRAATAKRFWFTTNDHRTLGQFTLVLHGEDLPPTIAAAEKKLKAYVDDIHWQAGPVQNHNRHIFWTGQRDMLADLERQNELFADWNKPDANIRSIFHENFTGDANALDAQKLRHRRRRILYRLYDSIAGFPPFVTRAHPMWPDLQKPLELVNGALEAQNRECDCLVVMTASDGGWAGKRLFEMTTGSHLRCAASTLLLPQLPENFFGDRKFDVAFCELGIDALTNFAAIYEKIRPHMNKGGEVIVYFFAEEHGLANERISQFVREGAPFVDESDIWFVGTPLHKWIVTTKMNLRSIYSMNKWVRRVAIAGFGTFCLPLIVYENLMGKNKASDIYTPYHTSVTLRFKVL